MKRRMLIAMVMLVVCSAYAGGVPSNVMDKIKRNAKLDHPGDESVQAYVVKEQCEDYISLQDFEYDGVPSEILRKIKRNAEIDHRDDYSVQLYVMREQCSAYVTIEEIKLKVRSDIRGDARASFPDDYSTQLYMMRRGLD